MDPAYPSYNTASQPPPAVASPNVSTAPPPPYTGTSSGSTAFKPVYPDSSLSGASSSRPAAAAAAAGPYPTMSGPYPTAASTNYPAAAPLLSGPSIVTVDREDGFLERQKLLIPLMPLWLSIILFVINTILPGIGTIIAGLCAPCTDPGRGAGSKVGSLCANFWIGLAQLILSPIIIGWVWSIFWGVLFVTQSLDRGSTTVTTITPHGRTADVTQTRTESIAPGVTVTHTRQGKVVDYGTNTGSSFGV